MNKSTVQIALSITKFSAQKGWSDEEFWEAIELLRFNKEDERQTAVEKLDSIPVTNDSATDYPIMLKVAHVAEVLGISPRKAYDIMDQKGFPLVKIGRKKVVPRDAFFNWLEKGVSA
ncbi:helix-turn-helix domain-containing protein [Bacillus thuringiensis]|uniref:DNA-binding protein n=1 Tax=Bacillus thuringiensis TaxID=1428 RepID=A0A9X6VDJ3_BACTU|nr:helix-turn-helix domain-containing protein [Bacillus thuringiensis]MCU5233908.1 helix-turn-helix domain-containing protein [Bacillus cereus]AMR82811.1 DNA-binding protein [Bacillus thuringiensis]KIP27207.1 prophage CP4-57 regulatory family protein [Bacillus thuringiensis serovar morrisoni]MBG9639907.1 DNA-binding protein [Bacillus thuringiensis]MBG9674666.1 DNA-binding protein [Bacillus thuringiensis]